MTLASDPHSPPTSPRASSKSQNDSAIPRRWESWKFKAELVLLILLTSTGAAIRLGGLTSIGLSHFDAGIYAQSGLWPWTGAFHFQQGFYSPPLYPGLMGVVNLLVGGPTEWSGAFISALAGTLLIPVCWWIGRSWFGPTAGWMVALFTTLDGLHIVFSRVGLTDELFTLLFMAGLACSISAVTKGGWARIFGAGLLVGLAWNTKYNGFLPLALSAGFLIHPKVATRVGRLASISLIAGLVYLPWALWFHVQHGYRTLIEHQRGYVQGWTGIVPNWREFLHDMDVVSPPILGISLFLIMAASLRRASPNGLMTLGIIALIGTGLEVIGWPWMLWIPAAFLGAWFGVPSESRIGFLWMLGGLLLLPAIYMPYLRLWLPTETVLVLLASGGFARTLAMPDLVGDSFPVPRRRLATKLALFLFIILFVYTLLPGMSAQRFRFWIENSYRPHAGYRAFWSPDTFSGTPVDWDEILKTDGRIFTLIRPPLMYELSPPMGPQERLLPLAGDPLNLREMNRSDLLLVDRAYLDTPSFRPTFDAAMGELIPTIDGPIDPDMVTILDDYHGTTLRTELPNFLQTYRFFLFRPR